MINVPFTIVYFVSVKIDTGWMEDTCRIYIFFIVLSVYLLVALLYYLSVCLSCCHSINNTEVEIGAITMIP